ncbi:hypothetical protein ACGC1H_003331 [Rhizoctonia solani]
MSERGYLGFVPLPSKTYSLGMHFHPFKTHFQLPMSSSRSSPPLNAPPKFQSFSEDPTNPYAVATFALRPSRRSSLVLSPIQIDSSKPHMLGTLSSHFSRHYSEPEGSVRRGRRAIPKKDRIGLIVLVEALLE